MDDDSYSSMLHLCSSSRSDIVTLHVNMYLLPKTPTLGMGVRVGVTWVGVGVGYRVRVWRRGQSWGGGGGTEKGLGSGRSQGLDWDVAGVGLVFGL